MRDAGPLLRSLLRLLCLVVVAGCAAAVPPVAAAQGTGPLGAPSVPLVSGDAIPGCGDIGTTFSSAAVTGTLPAGLSSDCFALTGVAAGDMVGLTHMGTNGLGALEVLDGAGNVICWANWGQGGECRLTGTGEWQLRVTKQYETEATMPYRVWARRLTDPQGCTAASSAPDFAFDAPAMTGSVTAGLPDRCLTFTRPEGAGDAALWPRVLRTSGAASFSWRIVGPSGSTDCSGSGLNLARCQLLATGQFSIVVRDEAAEGGSFALQVARTNTPAGCAESIGTSFASAAVSDTIDSGRATCRPLLDVAAGDQVSIGSTGAAQWVVHDGDGQQICHSYWAPSVQCQLSGAAGWYVVVYDQYGSAVSSTIAVRRVTNPQGCESIDPATFSFTAARVNGSTTTGTASRCYTFDRAADEADTSLWLRTVRTSGAMSPRWRVFGPSGNEECSGTAAFAACRLLGFGKHAIVVDDDDFNHTGSYFLNVKRLSQPTGCSTSAPVGFDAEPIKDAIATGGEVDCHTLTGLEAGDRVHVAFSGSAGSPRWVLMDADANQVCSSSWTTGLDCQLTGAGPWSHVVFSENDGSTFTYALATRRLQSPEGCTSLGAPDVWSFTSPRVNGSIAGSLQARCYTFTRGVAAPDESFWFRVIRASGTLQPQWRVYGPDGTRQCEGQAELHSCQLLSSGQHTLVVDAANVGGEGTYFVTPRRTTTPAGCVSMPSIAFGIPRLRGNLSTGGEVDCYLLPASEGDQLVFATTGSADRFSVLNPQGQEVCGPWGSTCTIPADGPHALLAYSSGGTGTGSYTLEAACQNEPCGQTNTAVLDATPSTVGSGSRATVLVRGRDLELLQSIVFVRGETELEGEPEPAAPDGRTRRVRLDTTGAVAGAYTLRATFSDGTTRELPNALTVTSSEPADVSLEIISRGAFRPGVPTRVTVQATNAGNVDAHGVSLLLTGMPAGSTIRPEQGVTNISGPAGAPVLKDAVYDQSRSATTTDDGVVVAPFLIPRVPGGSSVAIDFEITVPSLASYQLVVRGGDCFDQQVPGAGTAGTDTVGGRDETAADKCGRGLIDLTVDALDLVPFGACGALAYDAVMDGLYSAETGAGLMTADNAFGWGLGAVECGIEIFPPTAVAKTVVDVVSFAWGAKGTVDTAYACAEALSQAEQEQQGVASFDPNDIIGPAGSGDERYITGEGDLTYRVFFENLPAATAPVQRLVVTNKIDPATFDPASVRFRSLRFGDATVPLPHPVTEIDQTVDLRPANNLLVKVRATVAEDGLIQWVLEALDPDTLETPTDPFAGFLPPNNETRRGEGDSAYTVKLRDLPEGATVTNKATIVFDLNDPIDTPVWSNRIDHSPPTVGLTATPTARGDAAQVSWSGDDAASGVRRWDITVAKNGEPRTPWRSETEPGNATFTATEPGTYIFRATAHDGANNSTQSQQVAVVLAPATDPGGGPPPGPAPAEGAVPPSDGGGTPAPPLAPPTPTPVPTPTPPPPTGAGTGAAAVAPRITGKLRRTRITVSKKGAFSLPLNAVCRGSGVRCSLIVTAKPQRSLGKGLSTLGRRQVNVRAGRTGRVTGRLSTKAVKAIRKRKAVKAKVTIVVRRGSRTVRKTVTVTFVVGGVKR